jgi:hypothetical protein
MSSLNKIKLKQIDIDLSGFVSGESQKLITGYVSGVLTGSYLSGIVVDIIEQNSTLAELAYSFYTSGTSIVSGASKFNYFKSIDNEISVNLPTVYDKADFFIKNLSSGVVNIQSFPYLIDGKSGISIYQNESVDLFGLKNNNYTGWVINSSAI